jgi:hypothetical protein
VELSGGGKRQDRLANSGPSAKVHIVGYRQASLFASDINVSWVELDGELRVLLEFENDIIASHYAAGGAAPQGQFVG